MADNKKLADAILVAVGGKENVTFLAHCVTRLRFNLKDESIVIDEEVKSIEGVLGVQHSAGQYQVIVGPAVDKVFDELKEMTGIGEDAATTDAEASKPKGFAAIMKLISGIMMPVLPALTACGMISAVLSILTVTGAVSNTDGIYTVINGMGKACMYFLPVLIGASAAKHFGMDMFVGAVLGAILIYPSFIDAATTRTPLDILGLQLPITNYSSTVFPAIVGTWFASVLYKFFKKNIPSMFSLVLVPTLTIIIAAPLSLFLIGPTVQWLSTLLAQASLALYNFSPILCATIFGPIFGIVLIPLGLHWAFIMVAINNLTTYGSDPIMGMLCGSMAFVGVLLGYAIKSKSEDQRSLGFSTALTAAFGISEPGLFGIVLQHRETIIACIAAGVSSAWIPALFHTCQFVLAGSGIFSFPSYVNPDGSSESLIGAVICNIVAFLVGLIVTLVLYREKKEMVE